VSCLKNRQKEMILTAAMALTAAHTAKPSLPIGTQSRELSAQIAKDIFKSSSFL
jgi:hypothetical protein